MALSDLRFNITAVDDSGSAFQSAVKNATAGSRAVQEAAVANTVVMSRALAATNALAAGEMRHNTILGIGTTQFASLLHAGRGATEMLAQGVPITQVAAREFNNLSYALMGEQGLIAAFREVGVVGSLRGIGAAVAGLGPGFAAVGIAVGGVVAGIAGMEHEINKSSAVQVSFADVAKASFEVIADAVNGVLRPVIAAISPWFDAAWEGVVQGVKFVGNHLIAEWATAFDAVKDIWGNLPGTIGDVGISAANAMLTSIGRMLNGGIGLVDSFIAKINKIPGVHLDTIGSVNFGQIANPFAGAAGDLAAQIAGDAKRNFSTDYFGEFYGAVQSHAVSLAAAATNTAKGVSAAAKDTADALKQLTAPLDEFRDAARSAFGTFFDDLKQGKSLGTSFLDVLDQIGSKLLDKSLNNFTDAFLGPKGSATLSGTGILGTFGASIGHLFGFAEGGTLVAGGSGGPDSQIMMERVTPGELVDFTPPGKSRGGTFIVNVNNDFSGVDPASVARIYTLLPQIKQASIDGAVATMKRGLANDPNFFRR